MKLTNLQIYNYATALAEEFGDNCEIKFPVKINFYLQKNIQTLLTLAREIETTRMSIVEQYGKPTEQEGIYTIPGDQIEAAQKELADLLALEQEVQIYTVNINAFDDNLALSMKQMEALMFMIE